MDWTRQTQQTTSAIHAVGGVLAALRPYMQALESISLGPQELMVDGQSVGSWDPLAGMPVESAIVTAQGHSNDASNTLGLLSMAPQVLPQLNVGTDLATCLATLNAIIAAVGTPTAQQRQTIQDALQDITAGVPDLNTFVQALPGQMSTFMDQMTADTRALELGDASIATALTDMQGQYQQAVAHYITQPLGSSIVSILGQIESQMTTQLKAIQASLDAATQAAPSAVDAMSGMQGVISELTTELDDLLQQVEQAQDDQFVAALQQFDLQGAQDSWNDLVQASESLGPS